MTRVRRLAVFFVASVLLFSVMILPVYAKADININTFSDEQLYDYLMEKTKNDFLIAISEICKESVPAQITVVGVALSNRSDITDDELVQLISDNGNPYFLRRIAVETYAFRQPALIDDRINAIIADESEAADLRMILVSLLADFMNTSDVAMLTSVSNNADDNLAYNSIKALERVQPEAAFSIAVSIYENYEMETPARISIAAKVLSNHLGSSVQSRVMSSETITVNEFINRSAIIFSNTDNEEVRYAISRATESLSEDGVAPLTVTPRATGFQGYAAYRDGVISENLNLNWHAAIITGTETSMMYYIFAHARGSGATTELGSYSDFIGDGDPQGYYRPASTTLTRSQRDAVCATATDLAYARIPYVFMNPISYSISSSAFGKYPIDDILAIRCDGFVEYAYEYNDIRVYGDDTYWNISRVGTAYTEEHGGFQLTPRKQANDYMVRLGSL